MAPFSTKPRLGRHLPTSHYDQVKQLIKNSIFELKNEGVPVTYLNVSKGSMIPRGLFSSYPEFGEIISKENDLRARYFAVSKKSIEERLYEYELLILEAIQRLNKKNKYIAQTTVAKEIGVSRNIFNSYPNLKKIINKNRTSSAKINDDKLIVEVKRAIKKLKFSEQSITLKSISEFIKRDPETLKRRNEIKDLIATNHKIIYNRSKREVVIKLISKTEIMDAINILKRGRKIYQKRKYVKY